MRLRALPPPARPPPARRSARPFLAALSVAGAALGVWLAAGTGGARPESAPATRPARAWRADVELDASRRVVALRVTAPAGAPAARIRLRVFGLRDGRWTSVRRVRRRVDGSARVALGALPRGRYAWAIRRRDVVPAAGTLDTPCPVARPARRAPAWRCRAPGD